MVPLSWLNLMDRQGREVMGACRVQGFIGNAEEAVELLVDDGPEPAFGAELAKQLANNPRPFGAKALDLLAEPQILNNVGRNGTKWAPAEKMRGEDGVCYRIEPDRDLGNDAVLGSALASRLAIREWGK